MEWKYTVVVTERVGSYDEADVVIDRVLTTNTNLSETAWYEALDLKSGQWAQVFPFVTGDVEKVQVEKFNYHGGE